MLLTRRFDERMLSLQRQGRIGTFGPIKGQETRSETLAQKVLAYGIPGIQVDGNDILAVYAAAREAVGRARKGDGPTLIECLTYRMSVHTTADDPERYRKDEEVAEWEKRDPLIRFQKYLKERNLLSDEKVEELEEEINEKIQSWVKEYEEKIKEFGDPLDMFDNIFEELPDTGRIVKAARDTLGF
jgi:TPP-dependent pyruvate/acetoin dehydrogenase alpha subunit